MESLKRKLNITRAKRWNGYYTEVSLNRPLKAWTILGVEKVICSYFEIDGNFLRKPTRRTEVVRPRQIAMFFSKILCRDMSLASIGAYFGGKDHATVMSSCNTVNNLYETDPVYRIHIDELTKIFKLKS